MNRRPATPISLAIAYTFGGLAVLMVLAMLLQTSSNSDAIRQTSRSNAEALDLIKSCTIKPAGKCAQVQRERMEGFNHVLSLTVACADRPRRQSAAQIEACVRRRLDLEAGLPAPR